MSTIVLPEAIQELMRELMPQSRMPRYAYWKDKRGYMYCYTVEPIGGKFACFTYRPIGQGARSGKPRAWEPVDRVNFAKRKTAKARAYARYQKATQPEGG